MGRYVCDILEYKNRYSKDKKKIRVRKWGERINLVDDVVVLNSGLVIEVFFVYGNKIDNIREKRIYRRMKCFLFYLWFVEVLVVVDNRMVLYYGENF